MDQELITNLSSKAIQFEQDAHPLITLLCIFEEIVGSVFEIHKAVVICINC